MTEFLAFDPAWFSRHQRALLRLLNLPLIGLAFRRLLRINVLEPIVRIEPHAFTVSLGEGLYRTDFRTHWKFSKRIY